MHKVFINVARGHVERARARLSLFPLSSLSSPLASRERSSAFSLARSMRQTTVNQWASSAGSHPGIFPDGQRQQQQQHAPTRVKGRERERGETKGRKEQAYRELDEERRDETKIEGERVGERDSESAAGV